MKYAYYLGVALLAAVFLAHADEPKPEMHVLPDGQIHLIGAVLYQKHAINLFTANGWGLKWKVPIDTAAYNIKFESANGAPLDLGNLETGHSLEIEGHLSFNSNTNEYQILPTLIKDLSVNTGGPSQPAVSPQPAPTLTPTPQKTLVATNKLNMSLKPGYRGGQVAMLQKFLKNKGYLPSSEKATGVFGPLTKKALADFQQASALEATGTLGPKTRTLINSLLAQ